MRTAQSNSGLLKAMRGCHGRGPNLERRVLVRHDICLGAGHPIHPWMISRLELASDYKSARGQQLEVPSLPDIKIYVKLLSERPVPTT